MSGMRKYFENSSRATHVRQPSCSMINSCFDALPSHLEQYQCEHLCLSSKIQISPWFCYV
jgi:hypothetical protein